MAMAMATMAYTDDSMPERRTGQHRRGRAGAGRLGDLLHRAVLGAGEVLGQAADRLGQDEADDDGAEALPALVVVVVADVAQRQGGGADDGDDAGRSGSHG